MAEDESKRETHSETQGSKEKPAVIGTPFTKENQPSSEAKSAGRARLAERKRLMDEILSQQSLTIEDFMQKYMEKKDIKNDVGVVYDTTYEPKKTLQINVAIVVRYIYGQIKEGSSNALVLDWLDRHVSKAPTVMEHGGENGGDLFGKVQFVIVGSKAELPNPTNPEG